MQTTNFQRSRHYQVTFLLLFLFFLSGNAQTDATTARQSGVFFKFGANALPLQVRGNGNATGHRVQNPTSFSPPFFIAQFGADLSRRFFITANYEHKELQNTIISSRVNDGNANQIYEANLGLISNGHRGYLTMNYRFVDTEFSKAKNPKNPSFFSNYLMLGFGRYLVGSRAIGWQEYTTYDPQGNASEVISPAEEGYYNTPGNFVHSGLGLLYTRGSFLLDFGFELAWILENQRSDIYLNEDTVYDLDALDSIIDDTIRDQIARRYRLSVALKIGFIF